MVKPLSDIVTLKMETKETTSPQQAWSSYNRYLNLGEVVQLV